MKTLTDKIIKELHKIKDASVVADYTRGIEQAIIKIEELEKAAEFEEIARVMMKHLGDGKKYHPYHTVIITNATAELVEGVRSVGHIMDYVPD